MVDGTGSVYPSLVYNASGFPVIAYRDNAAATPFLKLATCTNALCTSPVYTTVDNSASTGEDPSIAFNSSGFPVISYFENATADLKVAICTDALCTAPMIRVLDTVGNTGQDTSLVLRGNVPVISYLELGGGLKLAVCSDPVCSAVTITTVDNGAFSGGSTGFYSSIVLNASGFPIMSYYSVGGDEITLAICTDVLCTAPILRFIDDGGIYSTVRLNSSGFPVISYSGTGIQDLRLATCNDALCSTHTITVVDPTGTASQATSMELNSSGFPVIAYSEVGGDLLLAVCNDAACTAPRLTNIDRALIGAGSQMIAMDLRGGNPVIAYFDGVGNALKLLVCDDPFCDTVPDYTSVAAPGSTITLSALAGSSPATTLAVSNSGDPLSMLDVALVSVSPGYVITGLPITGLLQGSPAVNIGIACSVPQPAGTLVVQTNEPFSPQYTYALRCTVTAPAPAATPIVSNPAADRDPELVIVLDENEVVLCPAQGCSPSSVVGRITRLPSTGEIPFWAGWLRGGICLAVLLLVGGLIYRFRWMGKSHDS